MQAVEMVGELWKLLLGSVEMGDELWKWQASCGKLWQAVKMAGKLCDNGWQTV